MSHVSTVNRVLQAHQVAAFAYTSSALTRHRAYRTPRYIAYPIYRLPGTKIARVLELVPEIEDALSARRGQAVRVRFSFNGFGIEIPRPQVELLPYAQAPLERLAPYQLAVGRAWPFGKAQEVTLDLSDADEPHLFVAGQTGCGKSVLMQSLVCSLAASTPPEQVQMVLVDLKGRSLPPLAHLPHVVLSATTAHEAICAVNHVFRILEERIASGAGPEPRLVLFIDELRELKFGDRRALGDQIPRIVALGREIGVHVIAATQYPLAGDIGPITKSQFPIRIVGSVSDANVARHTSGVPRSGAEKLGGSGDMLVFGKQTEGLRLQTYWIEDAGQAARRAGARWPGRAAPALSIPDPPVYLDRWSAELDKAQPVFENYYDPARGQLRHGGKSAILRTLRGPEVKLTGTYVTMVDNIVRELENRRSP